MEKPKFLALLLDPPYSTPLLNQRLTLLQEIAKKADEIALFFYMDGIHQLNDSQKPKNFANIGEWLTSFIVQHPQARAYACSRCTAARGYLDLDKSDLESDLFVPAKLLPVVEIVSVREFGRFLKEGYRLIQI